MLSSHMPPLSRFVVAAGIPMPVTAALKRLTITATLLILLGAACSESSPPVAPIAEEPGRIDVRVIATGGDIDDDFVVAVGSGVSRPRYNVVLTSASFTFAPGTHLLTLLDISPNCSVTGDNPQVVTVTAGAITNVTFAVTCAITGILVTTRTTGSSMPSSYDLLVDDNRPPPSIPANGSVTVSRLSAGAHAVTLGAGENCTVAGGQTVTVEVVNRTVTPVAFDVECSAVTVRLEKIAYTRTRNWGERATIGTVRPDGTSPVDLAEGHSPAWSRDGTQLLFSKMECTYDQSYNDEMCSGSLAILDPETRAVTTVANSVGATEPAWSPASNEIVFVRCCEEADRARLYLMRMDEPGASPVPMVFQSAAFALSWVSNPTWSPDGQRIAFTCYVAPTSDICVVKRDGSGLVRLTTGGAYEGNPAWSPDGGTIAFTSVIPGSGGQADIFTVNLIAAEGGPITALTTGANPAWSGDGKKLVFGRDHGLHTMDADGTNVKQLLPPYRSDAAWRP